MMIFQRFFDLSIQIQFENKKIVDGNQVYFNGFNKQIIISV